MANEPRQRRRGRRGRGRGARVCPSHKVVPTANPPVRVEQAEKEAPPASGDAALNASFACIGSDMMTVFQAMIQGAVQGAVAAAIEAVGGRAPTIGDKEEDGDDVTVFSSGMYISKAEKHEQVVQFLTLKQGNRPIIEYEKEFARLSCYVKDMIHTEKQKVRFFIMGLREEIQGLVDALEPQTYSAAVEISYKLDAKYGKMSVIEGKRKFEAVGSSISKWQKLKLDHNKAKGKNPMVATPERQRLQCKGCGKVHTGLCESGARMCYRCGKEGHYARQCQHAPDKVVVAGPPVGRPTQR